MTADEESVPQINATNHEINAISSKAEESQPLSKWWKNMNVEIFIVLYMFGSNLELATSGNLFMDRVCRVNMKLSDEICGNLTGDQDVLNKAQAQSNNNNLYITLISMLPGAFYAVFAGTWSDKYGRKPLLYAAILGTIAHDILYLLYLYFDRLPLEYCLVTFLPVSLTGGIKVVLGLVYSMASDQSGVAKRAIKYAILEAAIFMALPFAELSAGQLYKFYGFLPVSGLALFFHLLTLVFLTFVLKENHRGPIGIPLSSKLSDFFTLDAVKDNFKTCFKKRETYGRGQILILLGVACVILLIYKTLNSMSYFYANKMYGWDLPYYTTVSTIFSVVTMVIMLFAVPLTTKVLKLEDATLGLIGFVSVAAETVTKAFSYEPWVFYLSYVFGLLSGMGPVAFRSQLSKIVQVDELGKIFAVVAIFESLSPTPGSLLFTQIYNNSLGTFPGLVFLVGSFLLILPIGEFIWLLRLPRTSNYENLEGDLPSQDNVEPTTKDVTSIQAGGFDNVDSSSL